MSSRLVFSLSLAAVFAAPFLRAGTATVYFNDRKQVVTTYGGDLKLKIDTWVSTNCYMSLASTEQAKFVQWTKDLDLDVLRIPIYAEAQPSASVYDGSVYDNVKTVMDEFSGMTFFASPAENETGGWPDFMDGIVGSQDGSQLDTVAYNGWISRSLNTLEQAEPVTHLGPFNEDGTIPPGKKWKVFNNFPGRTRIGPDPWSLVTATTESGTIVNNGNALSHYIDIGGSHAYNQQGNYLANFSAEWSALGSEFSGKPLWATEATGFSKPDTPVALGAGYYLNALKGGVTGIVQYWILGQIIRFSDATTLAPLDGRYHVFKAFIDHTRGTQRVGSNLNNMPGARLCAFDQGNNKLCIIVANPSGTHTYAINGRLVSSVVKYEYTVSMSGPATAVNVGNIAADAKSFTSTSTAEAAFYVVTLQ